MVNKTANASHPKPITGNTAQGDKKIDLETEIWSYEANGGDMNEQVE